jgi:hypothetical protein
MLCSWLFRRFSFLPRPRQLGCRRRSGRSRLAVVQLEGRLTPSDCPLIEGQPAVVLVGNFSDNNPNVSVADFTATTKWSDGVTTTDEIVSAGPGPGVSATVYAHRTFFEAGAYAAVGDTTITGDGYTWPDQQVAEIVYDAPVAVSETSFAVEAGKRYTGPIATLTDLNPYATASDFTVSEWIVGQVSYFPGDTGPISNVHFEQTGGGFTLYATIDFRGLGPGQTTVGAGVWDSNPNAPNPQGGGWVWDPVTVTKSARAAYTTTVSSQVLSPTIGGQLSGELFSVQTTDPSITADNLVAGSSSQDILVGNVTETQLAGGVEQFNVNGEVRSSPDDCGPVLVPVTIQTPDGTLQAQIGYTPRDFAVSPVALSTVEGQPIQDTQVAVIAGPATSSASDYAATVDWGDGDTSTATITALGSGQFGVTASKPNPYEDANTYTVQVSVTGPGDDPPPPAQDTEGVADGTLEGQGETNLHGMVRVPQDNVVVAEFQDLGTAEPVTAYQVQIYWTAHQAKPDTGHVQAAATANRLAAFAAPTDPPALEVVADHWTPRHKGPFTGRVLLAEGEASTTIPIGGDVTGFAAPSLGELKPARWTINEPAYPGSIKINGDIGADALPSVTGLPRGLDASRNGDAIQITGTPTQYGQFHVKVALQDSKGVSVSRTYLLQIELTPLNQRMVNFLQPKVGPKLQVRIGSGECADIATEALRVAGGAFLGSTDGSVQWGTQFATIANGTLSGDGVEPGDIIQFVNGTGQHTMVVAAVDANGFPSSEYEQNWGTNRWMHRADRSDVLRNPYPGTITIYHPVDRVVPPAGPLAFSVVNNAPTAATVSMQVVDPTGATIWTPFAQELKARNTLGSYNTWAPTADHGKAGVKYVVKLTLNRRTITVRDGAGYEVFSDAKHHLSVRQLPD